MTMKALVRPALFAFALAVLLGASGCATVPAWQRERVLDRIVSFDAEAKEGARKLKAFEAREGSTGGAGGGCACK